MDGSRIKPATAGKVFRWIGKYRYVLLAVLLGAFLLLLPTDKSAAGTDSEPYAERFDLAAVQREMEEILSAVEGAGELRLMLTVRGSAELELARDRALTQKESGEEYSDKTETVVLGSGNGAEVVVTQSRYPDYVGALVVCEGGGSAAVRLQLTQAVSALTGLTSDRITVIKGRPQSGFRK